MPKADIDQTKVNCRKGRRRFALSLELLARNLELGRLCRPIAHTRTASKRTFSVTSPACFRINYGAPGRQHYCVSPAPRFHRRCW